MQPQDPTQTPPQPDYPSWQPTPDQSYYQPQQPAQTTPPQPPPYTPQVPYDNDDNEGMPQATYHSRPIAPAAPYIPPDILEKHEKSLKKYPQLNLSAGEYVVTVVRRHPIGLVKIWGGVLLGIFALIGGLFLFTAGTTADTVSAFSVPPAVLAMISLATIAVALLVGYIGTYVYRANNMYLTNESVTQNIQMTPFAHRKQTVSLGNIEDASYSKPGILATIFNFGEIRLSTEGDETTYRFQYATDPDRQVAILNDAVESFKNGRPIPTHK